MASEVRKKLAERAKKPNGPFVHYSPPRVIPLNPSQIRQWVRGGEVDRLELIVLEGQGKRLLEEHSVEPRTRAFLKTVPDMMARCQALHEAVKRGSLGELQVLIDDEVAKKKFVLCKDEAGVGLLHKAVFYDFQDIVKWLINNYPQTIHQRDSQGRTALHYACVCQDASAVAGVLEAAGALRGARDSCGRTPAQYARSRIPPTLPAMPAVLAARQLNGSGVGKDATTVLERSVGNMPREGVNQPAVSEKATGLVIKPSNIRIWCHDRDLGRLQRVVWQGHGARLLSEVSSQSVVKRFLEAVPYIMNTIREVHAAASRGDAHALRTLTADPVPPILLSAKDANGLTAAHKAAGLGNVEALDYIANRWPEGLDATDNEDRTPLHYAASLRGARGAYEALIRLGAEEGKVDSKQRTAPYYLNRPMELDRSWLNVTPDAPRTSSVAYPASWDWRLLEMERVPEHPRRSRKTKNSAEALPKSKTTDAIADKPGTHTSGVMHKSNTQEHIKELVEDPDSLTTLKTIGGNFVGDKKSKSKGLQNGIDKETPFIPLTELNGACDDDDRKGDKTRNENTEPVVNTESKEVKEDAAEKDTEDVEIEDKKEPHKNSEEEEAEEEEEDRESGEEKAREKEAELVTEEQLIKEQPTEYQRTNEKSDTEVSTKRSEDGEKLDGIDGGSDGSVRNKEMQVDPDAEELVTEGNVIKHKNYDDGEDEPENIKIKQEAEHDEDKVPEKRAEETNLVDTTEMNSDDPNHAKENSETGLRGLQNEEGPGHGTVQNEPFDEPVEVVELKSDKTNEEDVDVTKKSEKGSQNDNDDDDVQVPESDSEYGDSNLRSTAEALDSGSVERGNNGPNTQESLIEGVVHEEGEDELESGLQHDMEDGGNEDVLTLNGGAGDDEVDHLIKTTNMELLAALVLNGEGKRLMGKHSQNSELQSFLDNVPTYMNKIKRVHTAAREGNLRDLQAALDRRKFAIARDPISPNGATPLHVAVIFGKTNVIKYLGGRFPETLSAVDFEGRTALHYAASIPDNGHYYNLLQQLGANSKDLDDNGQSAEDFIADRSLLSLKQLLLDFGVDQKMADEMLTDKGKTVTVPKGHDSGHLAMPAFKTQGGKYLASSLGDPLIKGLTEVATVRPKDPVSYLAGFLTNMSDNSRNMDGESQDSELDLLETPGEEGLGQPLKNNSTMFTEDREEDTRAIDVVTVSPRPELSPDAPEAAFSSANRDEHGQSMLHFAAARAHSRNALFQVLSEADVSVAYRDELYRTARDVAVQAAVPGNTVEIDRWILHQAARGNIDQMVLLVMEGYDHILDIVDEEGASINDVVAQRGLDDMSSLLESITTFEDARESLHQAIRHGDTAAARKYLTSGAEVRPPLAGGRALAVCKNSFGRCSLHVAVLAQHETLVQYIANTYPETLRIGDNLERTALHYAMAIDKIESISKTLIQAGSKRVLKDLKGRQPTYYFMNKSEILRLKEEEEVY